MSNLKPQLSILLAMVILAAAALPVLAIQYKPGANVGYDVKYGNFVGTGPGYESFNNYDFLKLQVLKVSGNSVTLLSTGQFKNGTALPGNGTVDVWDVATGTDNGTPSVQGPIIAANLNQGDAIPPSGTYSINQTADRTYLGTIRSVNFLNVTVSTPDSASRLNYVYDKLTGMLLESTSTTTTQTQSQPITSTYSYSVIETNIFRPNPSPSGPEFPTQIIVIAVAIAVIAIVAIVLWKRTNT